MRIILNVVKVLIYILPVFLTQYHRIIQKEKYQNIIKDKDKRLLKSFISLKSLNYEEVIKLLQEFFRRISAILFVLLVILLLLDLTGTTFFITSAMFLNIFFLGYIYLNWFVGENLHKEYLYELSFVSFVPFLIEILVKLLGRKFFEISPSLELMYSLNFNFYYFFGFQSFYKQSPLLTSFILSVILFIFCIIFIYLFSWLISLLLMVLIWIIWIAIHSIAMYADKYLEKSIFEAISFVLILIGVIINLL
ncbi:hypothetical protein [Natroniella sp. ANB-PHB2]|uniref:hypothetical protein n=1 Tax=Natroniella sp. ANB-PHB2 TaxID=3384444 RepID=UPI0038D40B16